MALTPPTFVFQYVEPFGQKKKSHDQSVDPAPSSAPVGKNWFWGFGWMKYWLGKNWFWGFGMDEVLVGKNCSGVLGWMSTGWEKLFWGCGMDEVLVGKNCSGFWDG